MATKVFLKWLGEGCKSLTTGREYEHIQDAFPYVVSNVGESLCTDGKQSYWQRIEREVFTAHGFQWFKHTPGEPMPCDALAMVQTVCQAEIDGNPRMNARTAESWSWDKLSSVIGWRYADSEQKEPEAVGLEVLRTEQVDKFATLDAKRFNENAGCVSEVGIVLGKAFPDRDYNDAMICADMPIAAVDDGHLTPGQKAYIQGKEDAQAAKQQLKHDAEAKALQERADQLADAGKAMDRVNQDHGHRLGWMQ